MIHDLITSIEHEYLNTNNISLESSLKMLNILKYKITNLKFNDIVRYNNKNFYFKEIIDGKLLISNLPSNHDLNYIDCIVPFNEVSI